MYICKTHTFELSSRYIHMYISKMERNYKFENESYEPSYISVLKDVKTAEKTKPM